MRKLTLILFGAVTASASLLALADQPATTPAPAATSAPAKAPDSKPAATVAPAPAAATARAAVPAQKALAATNDNEKPIRPPPGWKVKKKGDATMYCRETTVIGTHFLQVMCMNEDQLRQFMTNATAMQQDLYQHQTLCASAAGCTNP
jgi:hypothetical protein